MDSNSGMKPGEGEEQAEWEFGLFLRHILRRPLQTLWWQILRTLPFIRQRIDRLSLTPPMNLGLNAARRGWGWIV